MKHQLFKQNRKIVAFFFSVLFTFGEATGQTPSIKQVDDVCNVALELVFKQGDSTQALKKMRQIEKQVSAYPTQKAVVQLYLGGVYMQYPNTFQQAMDYFTKAKPVLEKANELCHVGQINLFLSKAYGQNNDVITAQKYILDAERNLKKCADEWNWVNYYYRLGGLLVYSHDFTEAKLSFLKAEKLAIKHEKWRQLADIYTNMGNLFMELKQFNEAQKWLVKAQGVQKKYGYNQAQSLYFQIQMEENLIKYKELAEAMIIEQNKGGSSPTITGKGYMVLGDLYLHNKDYAKAKELYEQSLKLIDAAKIDYLYVEIYESLFRYYKAIGDYERAITYLEQVLDKYAIYTEGKTSNEVQQKQALYNLNKKNEEIEQLEKDKRTQQIILLLGILVGLGGIGVFGLILRNRKIEKQAMQTRLELQERELLSNTIYLEQRNEALENIKQQITEGQESKKILGEIERSINFEKDWEKFKLHFEQIHPDFFKKLLVIEPSLTDLDLKQCAYLKLGLSPKQVANLLNVTPHAVSTSRTRIKKRLNLQEEKSLTVFLNSLN